MKIVVISLGLVLLGSVSPAAAATYLVAEYDVKDPVAMQEFGQKSVALVKQHEGQYLAARTTITPVFGNAPKGVSIVQFPDNLKAHEYFNSPEVKALAELRQKAATWRTYLVEGGER